MRRDPFAPFGIQKPSQLITKSDQWLDDAEFLFRASRYSAALYLGGFVLECLLKAALWPRRFEPAVRRLLFRSHDLGELLRVNVRLSHDLARTRDPVADSLTRLSGWTVQIRYNPARVEFREASSFMDRLREVRLWLRERASRGRG